MKIYLDYIFLENLVINYIIIEELTVFVKDKVKNIKKLLISALIAVYTTIVCRNFVSILNHIVVKILVIIIAIYLLYKPKKLSRYIKLVIIYYLISFLYVGTIISCALLFKLSLSNILVKICLYIVSGIFLNIFTKYIWKIFRSNLKENDLIYTVCVGNVKIRGFVDTGSNVKLSNLDVMFISPKYYDSLKEVLGDEVDIGIKTVMGGEEIKGYIVENIAFYKNNKYITKVEKIVISFTLQEMENTEKYSAIISYNTYMENLKGVTI